MYEGLCKTTLLTTSSIVLKSNGSCIRPNIFTSLGSSFLKLNVPGTRRIRTESAVTTGSASRSCSSHSFFNFSARGTHVSRETASLSAQYACIPPPELTSVGFGILVTAQKFFSPTNASCWVS